MREDWLPVGAVAALARRSESAVRTAANSGSLGPLAERIEHPRGAYWMLHPALADPQTWAWAVGPRGCQPRESLDHVVAIAFEMMAVGDEYLVKECAKLLRSVRMQAPMTRERLVTVWRRAPHHGFEPTEALTALCELALREAGGDAA